MRHILLAAIAVLVLPVVVQAEEASAVPAPVAAVTHRAQPAADAAMPAVAESEWAAKGPPRALLVRSWLTAEVQRPWFTPLPARQVSVSSAAE
jgi:hypothetical protein